MDEKLKVFGQNLLSKIANQVNETGNADGADVGKALKATKEAAEQKTADKILNPDNIRVRQNQFKQATVSSLNNGGL